LTGVEVAGELVDYLNFRDRASAKIYLVELMPRVLPAFPTENVSNYAAKFISDSGVEILTDTAVQEVSEHEITFTDGTELPYDIIIWTAGIKPNSLLENLELGISKEKKGWLKVDPYLRVDDMKDVFAVGDTAYFEIGDVRAGQNVEEAERQGKLAAKNIIRTMKGKKLKRYRAKNTIQNPRAFISLGNDKAVMYFGGMMFKVFAYRVKKFVERSYHRGERRVRRV
jgi:NADH dehydrogenase